MAYFIFYNFLQSFLSRLLTVIGVYAIINVPNGTKGKAVRMKHTISEASLKKFHLWESLNDATWKILYQGIKQYCFPSGEEQVPHPNGVEVSGFVLCDVCFHFSYAG